MKHKCLNPNKAWICGVIRCKSDGIFSQHIVFSPNEAIRYFNSIYGSAGEAMMDRHSILVPCGKCAACQIRKRKEWTTRLSHEAEFFADACCFITLTYNDDSVPVTCFNKVKGDTPKMLDRGVGELPLQTLLPSDVQKFLKRLRRYLEYVPKSPKKRLGRDHIDTPIRYYAVGEYGGRFGRPHYHIMIFGWKPSDMVYHSTRNGHIIYRSAQIEKLWKFGFSTVEPVEGGVAKYCSRYVTKKFARLNDDNRDPFADSVFPEFYLQSVRNGGIGASFFDRNYETIMSRGYALIRNGGKYIKASIPCYYWRRCRIKNPCLWLELRDERIQFAKSHPIVGGLEDLQRAVQCYAENEKRLTQYELF